jgi:hypothetical protein
MIECGASPKMEVPDMRRKIHVGHIDEDGYTPSLLYAFYRASKALSKLGATLK